MGETPQPASKTIQETTVYGGGSYGSKKDSTVTVTKVIKGSDTVVIDKEVERHKK